MSTHTTDEDAPGNMSIGLKTNMEEHAKKKKKEKHQDHISAVNCALYIYELSH